MYKGIAGKSLEKLQRNISLFFTFKGGINTEYIKLHLTDNLWT